MSLNFGPNDDSAFREATARLDQEVRSWLDAGGASTDPALDLGIFFDWRWGYSGGPLDSFTKADLHEYLVEWCPRKLSFPPEEWGGVAQAVEVWIHFLVAHGRWRGGDHDALLDHLHNLMPTFIEAMGNPSNFGLGKGLMAGAQAETGLDLDLDDPESLQQLMDAFNQLPEHLRREITDGGMAAFDPGPPVDLGWIPEPDPNDVDAAAAAAPIIHQLEAAIDYLGPKGKPLTKTGNLKLVDCRALIEILKTDDTPDHSIGDHTYKLRTADELPHLQFLVAAAAQARAVFHTGERLVPNPAWTKRSPTEQVEALFEAMVHLGPISFAHHRRDDADFAIEDGFGHFVVPLLIDEPVDIDTLAEQALDIVAEIDPDAWFLHNPDDATSWVSRSLNLCFDTAERCGLLTRTGDQLVEEKYFGHRRQGGELRATALGRLVLRPMVRRAGYDFQTLDEIRSVSAPQLLELLGSGVEMDPEDLLSLWQPEWNRTDQARALVAAMQTAEQPHGRLTAVTLLQRCAPEAEPFLAALADTPFAGHAAMIVNRDNSAAAVGPHLLGPIIDMLAAEAMDGNIDSLLEAWQTLAAPDLLPDEAHGPGEQHRAQTNLIDAMWRIELPTTIVALEALGRALPDKAMAKAARKAVFQHRTKFGAS